MNIRPILNRHHQIVAVFTLIENPHGKKIEINDVNLRMILPEIIPQNIQIAVPAAANQHEIFTVQIFDGKPCAGSQRVRNRHCAANRLLGQLKCRAPACFQKWFIKRARHNVNLITEVAQNLPRIFRRVFKRNKLETDFRAYLLDFGTPVLNKLDGRHRRRADADDVFLILARVLCTLNGFLAVGDDIFGVLIERLPFLGELQPAMGADKQRQPQAVFQQIDLLDDRRRRNIQLLGGFIEAACIGNAQKRVELRVIHVVHILRKLFLTV